METLSICIATYSLSKGNGVDVSVAEFARELAGRHNVKLAVVRSDMEVEGVEIQRYNLRGPGKMLRAARDIERQKFDAISTHITPMDLVASLTNIPHLLHDPGVIPLSLVSGRADLYNWSTVNFSRLVSARRASAVLPISNYLAKEFRRKYLYRGKMDIVHAGIMFPGTEPAPVENKFGKYVLYVGVHRPYKGVHELIEIFADVKKELGDDVHLVTIGKPDNSAYQEKLRVRAAEVGNVHMLGYVKDVWPYYANCAACANCSLWEGQDRPVLEAQYMGKPAVTYNNCSHPEVIFHGTLARDRKEFKDALVKYLREDHSDLSARREVVDEFSVKTMAGDFIGVLKGGTLDHRA
jgi:glycosyltransferase involved in cell wall biosynthesis